ncbi:transcription factor vib-1 [Apiospora kogelbergensis]|uniref:Transcription factor vib-1 n=1 Tax=Apiospora kogelbergensis TaxID=1337665 RepID=A0AAW0QWV5_9PEZI
MSSMLKKKGLGFKPKAKPARTAAPAAASPSQTPATTESPSQSQSQASTPAPPLVTPQVPTVSTPNTLGTDNAEPTIQEPQEKEREKEKDAVSNAATAVSSTTIAKPHEPPTIPPAPAPEPTNPLPTPDDRPIEPTDSRPPEKSNASIPPKPATPDVAATHQDEPVQPAMPVPTPSQPPSASASTAVTSRVGLSATPAPDGLATPTATQPPSTAESRPGLATPVPDGLMTPAATQPQDITDNATPSVAPGSAPSSQLTVPRRELPSPPSAPITNTVVANAAAADVQSTEAGAPTAEPRKKRQYRKRKAPAPAEGEQNGEAAPAAPKPKRQRKKKTAPEEGAENEDGTPAAPKPRRKRKNDTAPAEGGDAQVASGGAGIGVAAHTVVRRKRREPTPEDAENQEIDHTTTKMADITRDLGIGKKFKHSEAILERQREARRNAQRRRLERKQRAMGLLPEEPTGEDGAAGNNAEGTPAPEAEEPSVMDGGGVEYDIIDGQIVVNQNSLTVNQHENQDFTNLETVEEDEFTNLTTSASYLRASKTLGTNHWSDDETERFYHYLKMFGTDFETISHVFPGKSRRHIKLKFNREEKARPKRINAAIMARGAKKVAIDLEDFKSQWQGEAWQEPDNIRADQARVAAQYEEHLEELRQQRRELGLLDDEEPAPAANSDAAEGGEDGGGRRRRG